MNKENKIQGNSYRPAMPIGPGRGMGLAEKPKDFSATIRKLASYLKPFWVKMFFVFVFAVASMIFVIVSPRILGDMTNQIVSDLMARHQVDIGALRHFVFKLLCLYVLSAVFSYVQGWIMTGVAQKIAYRFRRDISGKINRLPLAYFDRRTFGEVLSRVTNDVDTVSQTLNQTLSQIITSFTLLVGILAMMVSISGPMTIVSLLLIPLSFGLIALIVKRSQRYFRAQQVSLGEINGHIEEMYAGHNVMRVFNGQARSIQKFELINAKLFRSAWKAQFLSGLMWPIMIFVGNLGFVGVSVLGAWLAVKGRIGVGDIQAFIQYVSQFNQPIIQTANIANVLQSTAAAAERVFDFLEEKEEAVEDRKQAASLEIKGKVEFENVVFGYDKDKLVIKGFNASIKPGQRIAIVGPTGAGKTTLVNLLMRFYEVSGGAIRIDGVDIRDLKRADLRRFFGMVLQDVWLINGTIRENIAYGKPEASEAEIVAAARAAQADHFIHALPRAYDFQLNEEADNISQGEKQLLTIARAMLVKAPMLILDEATSSVDTRTEALIQKAMENLMAKKTSFVIAHRLSTIRNADLILVINDGNIAEQGRHEDLIRRKGPYAALYDSQFFSDVVR